MYQNVIPVSKTYAEKENHFEKSFLKFQKKFNFKNIGIQELRLVFSIHKFIYSWFQKAEK